MYSYRRHGQQCYPSSTTTYFFHNCLSPPQVMQSNFAAWAAIFYHHHFFLPLRCHTTHSAIVSETNNFIYEIKNLSSKNPLQILNNSIENPSFWIMMDQTLFFEWFCEIGISWRWWCFQVMVVVVSDSVDGIFGAFVLVFISDSINVVVAIVVAVV